MSDIREYLSKHIEECRSRIETIQGYIESHKDADSTECRKNIAVLQAAIAALREKQHNDELRQQGRLVELPCDIGTRVYKVYQFCGLGAWEIEVHEVKLEDLAEIGKTIFLTREEAQAVVDRMEADQR